MSDYSSEETAYIEKLLVDFHKNISLPLVIGVGGVTALALHNRLLPRHPKFFVYPRHIAFIGIGTLIADVMLLANRVNPRFDQQFPGARIRVRQTMKAKASGLLPHVIQQQTAHGLVFVPPPISEMNSNESKSEIESRDFNTLSVKSYEQLRMLNQAEFWGKQRTNIDRLSKVSTEQIASVNQPAPRFPKTSYGDEGFYKS